jgi:hypothetical protein
VMANKAAVSWGRGGSHLGLTEGPHDAFVVTWAWAGDELCEGCALAGTNRKMSVVWNCWQQYLAKALLKEARASPPPSLSRGEAGTDPQYWKIITANVRNIWGDLRERSIELAGFSDSVRVHCVRSIVDGARRSNTSCRQHEAKILVAGVLAGINLLERFDRFPSIRSCTICPRC